MLIKVNYENACEELETLMRDYCEMKGLELLECSVLYDIVYRDEWQDEDDISIFYKIADDVCNNALLCKKLNREVEHNIRLSIKHKQYNFNDDEMYAFYEDTRYCVCDVFKPREFLEYCYKITRNK